MILLPYLSEKVHSFALSIPVRKHGSSGFCSSSLVRIPFCARYELIHLNRLRYHSRLPHTSVGDITENARGSELFFLTSEVRTVRSVSRVFLHDGGIPGEANRRARARALYSWRLEYGSERPLTVIASFSMSPRDSAWHMTYVATGLGHGTEPCDSSSRSSDLFPDTFYHGMVRPVSPASHQVVVTCKRTTLWGDRGIDPPRF